MKTNTIETKPQTIRSLTQIDADLAEAARRRRLHANDPITTAGNTQAINALLDEHLAVTR